MKLFKLFCKVLIQKHSIHLQASYRYVWQKQCGRENLLEHSRPGRDCAASLGRLLHTLSRTGKTFPIFNFIVATFCVMRQCQHHSLLYCRNKYLYRLTWRSLKFWNAKAMGEFFSHFNLLLLVWAAFQECFEDCACSLCFDESTSKSALSRVWELKSFKITKSYISKLLSF